MAASCQQINTPATNKIFRFELRGALRFGPTLPSALIAWVRFGLFLSDARCLCHAIDTMSH